MSDRGQVEHEAPERLVNWFARPGYRVTLLVSRQDGEPMSDDDEKRIGASLRRYEEKDVESDGPAFEPPDGSESDE